MGDDGTLHIFVDEAGDSTLFEGRRGKIIVDTPGCSRFFIMGKLEVDDPVLLSEDLTRLRQELVGDVYHLGIAKRGQKDRNHALRMALEKAERTFEATYGFCRGGEWKMTISNSQTTVCLQAVDYFLWALQRFYEQRRHPATGALLPREDRYLNLLWPQMAEIHDLDFGRPRGTFYGPERCLSLGGRFLDPPKSGGKP